MKTLGLFPSFANFGGVERSGRAAWEAIILASRGSGGGDHLLYFGTRMEHVSHAEMHHAASQAAAVALAMSREWPVDVVLVWHIGLLKLIPFVRTRGAPVALYLHGSEAWKKASIVTRTVLRRVDLFLTNSDYTWERFLSFHPEYSSASHLTVALGLDSPVATISQPSGPPSALMIGRIASSEAYKGHDAVIGAWSSVRQRIPRARLRMIGPCEMREELLRLAVDNGVADAIEIAGPVTEGTKERYLADCRCMALPSRGEGFGLAYIESMRMGRPCLVSTLDAGREVVCPDPGKGAGLAVDPSDSAAVADALVRLMTPGTEWDEWSRAGAQRYTAHYTERRFRARLLDALDSLS